MCAECVESLERVFPGQPEEVSYEILIGMTAFPFAHGPVIEKQLRIAKKAIAQGRGICMMCGKAKAYKHMKHDFCKEACLAKWEKSE